MVEVILGALAIIGLIVSIVALIEKHRLKIDRSKENRLFCDFHKNISCTKALGSDYSALLGVPNSVIGIAFYLVIFFFALLDFTVLIFIFSIPAVAMSLVLAFISYFRQHNACLVCHASYAVNIALLVVSAVLAF